MIEGTEFNDTRRSMFTAHADAYEAGRPGYPNAVFEYLAESCGLVPACRVLEIGPGTGQATEPLLDAGAHVIAVELGSELGDRLRAKYRDRSLEVVVGDFVSAELQVEPFDLVCSATAFHWVDPTVGFGLVADQLRPGGTAALWWNFYGDVNSPDPLWEMLHPLIAKYAPQLASGAGVGANPYALDVEARTAEFAASGRFDPVTHRFFRWTATHTAPQVRALFASFSEWMALDEAVREPLLDEIADAVDNEFGGMVERPYTTAIYSASRH